MYFYFDYESFITFCTRSKVEHFFRGVACVVEWKTLHDNKRVNSLYEARDVPLQLAAYAGAINHMQLDRKASFLKIIFVDFM